MGQYSCKKLRERETTKCVMVPLSLFFHKYDTVAFVITAKVHTTVIKGNELQIIARIVFATLCTAKTNKHTGIP